MVPRRSLLQRWAQIAISSSAETLSFLSKGLRMPLFIMRLMKELMVFISFGRRILIQTTKKISTLSSALKEARFRLSLFLKLNDSLVSLEPTMK